MLRRNTIHKFIKLVIELAELQVQGYVIGKVKPTTYVQHAGMSYLFDLPNAFVTANWQQKMETGHRWWSLKTFLLSKISKCHLRTTS